MGRAPQPAPQMQFSRDAAPEVLSYFRNKGFTVGFDWRDVWAEEHAHAFTVAKATQMDVLRTIREEVDRAIADGLPFRDFQANLTPRLQRLGWWGVKPMVDPRTGETINAQLGSPHRLRIIFDANIRTANAAGQWVRIQRSKAVLPFLAYQHTTSIEPREEHWAWAEEPVVLHADDPWWDTHFPPNGWQCKCWVLQVDEEEARALGWTRGTKAPDDEMVPWYNARSGETVMIPEGIDPGWQTNPGKTRASIMDALLNNKLEDVDPAIRATALKDITSSPFFKAVADGKIDSRPNELRRNPLMPEVVDALRGKFANQQVAVPAGHLSEAIQRAQGWQSGVVWLDPEGAALARDLAGKAGLDWTLLPRILDEGAIVRNSETKDWLTAYRQIDGQWFKAEVMLRDLAPDGAALKAGVRLRLESLARIDAKSVRYELETAKFERTLLRDEAAKTLNIYDLKPAAAGALLGARPRAPGEEPPEGVPRPRLPGEEPPEGSGPRPRLPDEEPPAGRVRPRARDEAPPEGTRRPLERGAEPPEGEAPGEGETGASKPRRRPRPRPRSGDADDGGE